jgi:signal transduction histidine kinase
MKILSRLNSIAARIAAAIILAIFLGLATAIGLNEVVTNRFLRNTGDDSRTHYILSKGNVSLIKVRNNQSLLSGRIVATIRAAASAPVSERPRIVAAMTQPDLEVALDTADRSDAAGNEEGLLYALHQLVGIQLEMLSPPVLISTRRVSAGGDDHRLASTAELTATLADGQRIVFTIPNFPEHPPNGLLLFLSSIVFVAIVISILTAHRLAAPIRDFATAADRLGVDLTAAPLALRGPQELRATIRTVNRMQQRLQRFLEDRTQMLAAISHDLRAPLARLHLRVELVANREQQRKMFDDLQAMNAMIDSTLAFARDEARQEPRSLVDLGILVGDVCEDAGDAGGLVSYAGRRGVDISCRPTMVRRAVANLVDNAVKYGGSARVNIVRDTDRVAVVVDDDGPGIPPEEYEKVFAPFYRRDPARDPAKAGVGLGLSIARTVAREHGGDVTLKNRDAGGLRVLIELPA